LDIQLEKFNIENKLVEAQRLRQRTMYDIEMLNEIGFVNGIENYSRIIDGREPGSRPYSLIDFFKKPFLTIIDESHVTIPQISGMFNGDFARKTTLVEHGFRIPSALDNRPLKFNEFENLIDFAIYSSATPADYELEESDGIFVEQIIRPTGLVDPPLTIRPAKNQVDDLIDELHNAIKNNGRVLVTTLTKKMAENLSEYLDSLDFKVKYLHSDIHTLDRPEILRELREGNFDILVGIILLREGLDLPEVTLVAILDADKEGFLRSTRSIIQIAGRAARNVNGRIILYADTVTKSIEKAVKESTRRRNKQLEYNKKYHIIPKTTMRKIGEPISPYEEREPKGAYAIAEPKSSYEDYDYENPEKEVKQLEMDMQKAAKKLEFEKAAQIRDKIAQIRSKYSL
jgi:excinuclease ABC subunit B